MYNFSFCVLLCVRVEKSERNNVCECQTEVKNGSDTHPLSYTVYDYIFIECKQINVVLFCVGERHKTHLRKTCNGYT